MKANGILEKRKFPASGRPTVEKVAACPPLEAPRISKPDRIDVEREAQRLTEEQVREVMTE